LVISSTVSGAPRLLIEFGTGQRTQLTNLSPVVYASGTQSLYGVWDWNMSAWNALSPSFTYLSLAATNLATGLNSPYTLGSVNLTAQTLTANTSTEISGAPPTVIDGTSNTICWQGSTTCGATGNTSYGWYVNLIEGNPTAVPGLAEQVIFNPVFYQGAFLVNTTVPANNLPTSCSNNQDSGYTYALNVGSGAIFTNTFPTFTQNGVVVTDSLEAGVETNATGSVYIVSTAEHTTNIIYQTISGTPGAQEVNIPSNTKAKRLTWVELR
jgi:type IV pilus assembly protein PilY1